MPGYWLVVPKRQGTNEQQREDYLARNHLLLACDNDYGYGTVYNIMIIIIIIRSNAIDVYKCMLCICL